ASPGRTGPDRLLAIADRARAIGAPRHQRPAILGTPYGRGAGAARDSRAHGRDGGASPRTPGRHLTLAGSGAVCAARSVSTPDGAGPARSGRLATPVVRAARS